jgi:uncharacterized protein (TIGR03067 family)
MRVFGFATLVSVVGCCVAVGAPGLKDVRKPVDPPVGEWWFQKWQFDGEAVRLNKDQPGTRRWTVTLAKNKAVINFDGRPLSGGRRVEYYETGTALEFDLSPDLRAADPKTLKKGIWKVDGDTLLFCYGEPGGERPTDFTAPEGSGHTLLTLKRKPKE